MNCPEIGALRAALEQPAALREPTLAAHLDDCPTCRSTLAGLRRSADLAAPAMALLAPPDTPGQADVTAALRRVAGTVPTHGAGPPPDLIDAPDLIGQGERGRRARRWSQLPGALRAAAVAVVVAVALGAVVATPSGRGAAASLLAQFRSERLAVVSFDPNDPGLREGLGALQSVGTVDEDAFASMEPERVAGPAEASRRVGFEVRGVGSGDLPAGTRAEPTTYVTPAREVRFTFDRDKARRFVAEQGSPKVDLPAKFDGASLVVEVPAAAVLVYPGPDRAPRVMVGQAGQLNVRTEGDVTLAEMREFLLGLPGLPSETVRQLRAISDWRTTLPVFVPVDKVDWKPTTVNGVDALAFSDRGGVASAVIWQRDGRIYGVGGPIRESAARAVAEGLGR